MVAVGQGLSLLHEAKAERAKLRRETGQVPEVLEILVWESSLKGFALKPVRASYS